MKVRQLNSQCHLSVSTLIESKGRFFHLANEKKTNFIRTN